MKYENLLRPLKVNKLILRNRIMAAPMEVGNATAMISTTYYGGISLIDKSRGGAGLICVGADNDNPVEGIFSKYGREKTREVIYLVKQSGGKIAAEVTSYGKLLVNGHVNGPVSGIRFDGFKMDEMTRLDMDAFCERVGKHCRDCRDFGYDMVLFCCSADSLCGQFLSPYFNTRKDEYGGSFENRSRFPLEIIRNVREYVGKDYPIQLQVSRSLMVPETYSEDEMLKFLQYAEKYVDMINITSGMDTYGGTYNNYIGSIHAVTTNLFPHAYGIEFCEKLKKLVNVPISLVGGISDPDEAEKLIADGKLDAVMLGRQLVADPYWGKKLINKQEDDIVPCIRCTNCYHYVTEHKNVVCTVNPRYRREKRVPLRIEKNETPKNVLIVGGGPAGCKAAITAAERGHNVTIIEKENRLGGLLNCAEYSELKSDLRRYRDYLLRQVEKHNIKVLNNTIATPNLIKEINPDSLIISIGSEPIEAKIEGAKRNSYSILDVYFNNIELKGNVTIIGGGQSACELAIEIADKVDNINIIEKQNDISLNSNSHYRLAIEYMFNQHNNINIYTNSTCKKICEDKVVIETKLVGEQIVKSDVVIMAVGFKPKMDEVERLYGIVADTYEVGDCEKVASVLEATNNAYLISLNI